MKVLLAEGTGLLEKQPIISTLLKNGHFYVPKKLKQETEYQYFMLLISILTSSG